MEVVSTVAEKGSADGGVKAMRWLRGGAARGVG